MTEVRFIKAAGGNNVGATLETTPGAAAYLIEAGIAEAVKATRKAGSAAKNGGGGDSPAEVPKTAG